MRCDRPCCSLFCAASTPRAPLTPLSASPIPSLTPTTYSALKSSRLASWPRYPAVHPLPFSLGMPGLCRQHSPVTSLCHSSACAQQLSLTGLQQGLALFRTQHIQRLLLELDTAENRLTGTVSAENGTCTPPGNFIRGSCLPACRRACHACCAKPAWCAAPPLYGKSTACRARFFKLHASLGGACHAQGDNPGISCACAGLEKEYRIPCLESEILQTTLDKAGLPTTVNAAAKELNRYHNQALHASSMRLCLRTAPHRNQAVSISSLSPGNLEAFKRCMQELTHCVHTSHTQPSQLISATCFGDKTEDMAWCWHGLCEHARTLSGSSF